MNEYNINPENLFDLSRLNEEELGQLEYWLLSPAWEGYGKLYLKSIIKSVERLMKDRSEDRKKRYNDDFLAGQCTALEGFIAFCDGLVQNLSMARVAEVQKMTPNEEYDRLRTLGFVRHSGQVVRAEELDPAEDY
jgi:hypothetical protein